MEDSSEASLLAEQGEACSPMDHPMSANENIGEHSSNESGDSNSNEFGNASPVFQHDESVSIQQLDHKPVKSNSAFKPEETITQDPKTEEKKADVVETGSLDGDAISEEENFKENEDEKERKEEEELDFEEGEQTNSPPEPVAEKKKREDEEDGEVDSDDDLEEGEVKEDDDELKDAKNSSAAQPPVNPSICRFFHKGLCTWGANCRFIHNEPLIAPPFPKPNNSIASRLGMPNKPNELNKIPNKIPLFSSKPQPQIPQINRPMNQVNTYGPVQQQQQQQQQPPPPLIAQQPRILDKNWERMPPSNYKTEPFNQQRNIRIDREPDFDRANPATFDRSRPRYQNQPDQPPYSQGYSKPRNPNQDSNWESEYERKRRLAFEAAPWNNGDEPTTPARTSGVDRYGNPIVYSRDRSESSRDATGKDGYRDSSRDSSREPPLSRDAYGRTREPSEQYRDPWRRSKSPNSKSSFVPPYKHSKSDSGSNFSESEEGHLDTRSEAHKRRLDPNFANKHRPSSFKDPPLPSSSHTGAYGAYDVNSRPMPPLDTRHPSGKGYFGSSSGGGVAREASPAPLLPAPYDRSPPVYNKSGEKELAGPMYERPKNLPPRSRKDSWSDSESSCSSSSYSGSNSGSSSNSDPEHYSRTNKFESTRTDHKSKNKIDDKDYYAGEPHSKKARMLPEAEKYDYIKTSKSKGPKSPPPSGYSPHHPSRYSPDRPTTSRKKVPEYGLPEDESYSNGRQSDKRLKSSKSKEYYSPPEPEMYVKSSKGHNRDHLEYSRSPPEDFMDQDMSGRSLGKKKGSRSDLIESADSENGDSKKIELLQQLKKIEEAIARKRSKLK